MYYLNDGGDLTGVCFHIPLFCSTMAKNKADKSVDKNSRL